MGDNYEDIGSVFEIHMAKSLCLYLQNAIFIITKSKNIANVFDEKTDE